MKNKRVKQMICDVLNHREGFDSSFKYVWMDNDLSPCLVAFNTANFIWPSHGVVRVFGRVSTKHK